MAASLRLTYNPTSLGGQHVAQLSGRAATLASELASAQAKLKAAEARLAEINVGKTDE